MITGNKGEWSEIYALLKILSDKQLSVGDGDLNKIESILLPVIKILRKESNGTHEYSYESDLVIVRSSGEEFRIPISTFQEKAASLLSKLKGKTDGTFSIPEIETFMSSFNSISIKTKSSIKSDIRIVVHDQRTGATPELGFSIKSKVGKPSTLLNSGKTTNFIYEIENVVLSVEQIQEINSIDTRSKIRDRVAKIIDYNGTLKFIKTENIVFGNNLTLIDSALTQILAEIVYLFFKSNCSKTAELVEEISKINPLGFNLETNHPFYSYKMKRLLTDVALGMVPSKVWTGKFDTTGGYLIVKEDGDVLCYHIYNRNEFEDYLLNNTKLETPSSSRHDFGSVYQIGTKQYFKLNIQIRFLD